MTKRTKTLAVVSVLVLAAMAGGVAQADDQGNWLVRVRALYLSPDAEGTDALTEADVKGDGTIEVDFSRFLTDHLALELIAATSAHEITLGGASLGSVHVLPPTLTFQYHFIPDGTVRPYLGAGVNFTVFYDKTGLLDDMEVDDSFGFAGQLGADFAVGKVGLFNIDVKYINIETTVAAGGSTLGDLKVNPWVIGVGFGHRF